MSACTAHFDSVKLTVSYARLYRISYAQGFMLMREAAREYNWNLNYAGIALMWRGGCIIRSVFLGDITSAYTRNPELENLLFDDFFNKAIHKAQPGWRRIIAQTALWGIPTPAFSTALSFFDGYRTERLPASLLQAQRDYFGAHTFKVSSLRDPYCSVSELSETDHDLIRCCLNSPTTSTKRAPTSTSTG